MNAHPDPAGILKAVAIEVAACHGVTVEELMRPRRTRSAQAREAVMARVSDACPALTLREIAALFGIGGKHPDAEVCRRIAAYKKRLRQAEDEVAGRRPPGRPAKGGDAAPVAPPPLGLAFGAFEMHPRSPRPDCRPDPLQWAADGARWRGFVPAPPATGHSSIEAAGSLTAISRRGV